MSNLLSSNFSRLWKNKIFWLCMGGMLIYAVAYMLNASQKPFSYATGTAYTLEDYYFQFLIYASFFFAVVSSMFLGTDYSDGTIRNKLIVGHTRAKVYHLHCFKLGFLGGIAEMHPDLVGGGTDSPVDGGGVRLC